MPAREPAHVLIEEHTVILAIDGIPAEEDIAKATELWLTYRNYAKSPGWKVQAVVLRDTHLKILKRWRGYEIDTQAQLPEWIRLLADGHRPTGALGRTTYFDVTDRVYRPVAAL
jgi:hypothetical protein